MERGNIMHAVKITPANQDQAELFSPLLNASSTSFDLIQSGYLAIENETTVGLFLIEHEAEDIALLSKCLAAKLDHPEQLIELIYLAIQVAANHGIKMIKVPTEQKSLTDLLSWIGFKPLPHEDGWGYLVDNSDAK